MSLRLYYEPQVFIRDKSNSTQLDREELTAVFLKCNHHHFQNT